MKVLVIGGAGYIGGHVVREFLDAGHAITVYDNFSTGQRENLFAEAELVEGDILDYNNLHRVMQRGYDGLVHLAASKAAGESMLKPEKYSVNNLTGTINIINAAVETGIKNFVFSSSAAVYGEPQYLPIDELHSANPENYYGFTKLEIERILAWYDKLKSLRSACLRYFNAAGYDAAGRIKGLEQNPANLLPVIMEVAVGKRKELHIFGKDYATPDGTGVRDYVHVTDLAKAHLASLNYINSANKSIIVNLGSENGLSVLELVECTRRITGKEIPVQFVARRPGDPAKLVASSKLAKDLLGWEAKHSNVEDLVSSTWQAYKTFYKI